MTWKTQYLKSYDPETQALRASMKIYNPKA